MKAHVQCSSTNLNIWAHLGCGLSICVLIGKQHWSVSEAENMRESEWIWVQA